MAGLSRPKDGVACARLCPGHPRLLTPAARKTWMPGIADKFTQSAQGRLLCPGMTVEKSTAPYRRHCHLLAPAGAAIDLLAGTKLQILVHADTYFAEPVLVAGHGDRRGAQAGIGLDEGLLDLRRRNGLRSRQFEILFRDFHGRTRLADGLEIGARP